MNQIVKHLFLFCLFLTISTLAKAIPNNEIHYTSVDGKVVKPNYDFSCAVSGYSYYSECFGGVGVVSNTYKDGQGIIKFRGDLSKLDAGIFGNCYTLTSIEIPNSVTSIGQYAFQGCSGLTSIVIPNSVASIGRSAFSYCSGLTSIKVDSDNKKYDSRDNCNAIIETSTNTLIAGCKNTIIPNSVTSIGKAAFSGRSGLTNIEIPSSVISIESSAFSDCSGLTSIVIPNSVTSIGSSAFDGCSGLTSIVIPNSVTSIGNYAFGDCSGLTSIVIPNSVTSIGESAFKYCKGLTSIEIPNSVTSIEDYAFQGCSGLTSIKVNWARPLSITAKVFQHVDMSNCVLYVPKGTSAMYMSAPVWIDFINIQEFSSSDDGDDTAYITIKLGTGGILKQVAELGKTYQFVIEPEANWEINTATFNGNDITWLLNNGQFTTPVITGNSEISVVFKQKIDGIMAPTRNSDIKVSAYDGMVTVSGAEPDDMIKAYTTSGTLVKSARGNTTITLDKDETYIIKVGMETYKVRM